MSFTVIIPARFASSRLHKKVLANLGGKPMVVRVAERAAQSNATHVIVATDHYDIYSVCMSYGINVTMTKVDHVSGTDRVAEVAATLNLAEDAIIVNVQGDEPLIDPNLISKVASYITPDTDIATVAHKIKLSKKIYNPNIVKVILNKKNQAIYFSRAAIPWHYNKFPDDINNHFKSHFTILRHIGLYAYTNKFLKIYNTLSVSPLEKIEGLEQLRILWHGYNITVHVTQLSPEIGVDTLEDLKRIQQYF